MVAHVAHNSGNNEWYTPLLFLDKARQVLGQIDLDPCSSLVAQENVKASKFYTKEDDGLSKEWFGNLGKQPLQGQVFCYKGNNKDLFVDVFKDVGNCMVKHET